MADFSRRSSRTSMRSKLLGQLLVENGDCSSEQVNAALAAQEKQGGLIGAILQNTGVCDAHQIAQALQKQVQVTDVQCDDLTIPGDVVGLVAKEFCIHEKLCPFELLGGTLCVVMGNPLNRKAISEVEAMTRLKVKAFKAVWPKISGLIERSYVSAGSGSPPPAPPQTVDDLTLDLDDEPAGAHTAPPPVDDDIIPPSAPAELSAEAGILPAEDEMVPVPKESAVFTKPVIQAKISGLENLDSGEAQLVDVSRRTGRTLGAAVPKPKREAKVNVDLDTFDQSRPAETIDDPRGDPDALDEIPAGDVERAGPRGDGEVLVVLKIVPDAYFYQGVGPKNAPRAEDLLDIIEALPVAEVVAETIADYERQKAGVPAASDAGLAHKSARFANRVEYQRAPATPMAAVRLGEGEFQKSTLTLAEDFCGDWEWMVASPGPIAVDSFED